MKLRVKQAPFKAQTPAVSKWKSPSYRNSLAMCGNMPFSAQILSMQSNQDTRKEIQ
jgi:hypothetical protein